MSTPDRPREPIDLARDEIARRLEREFPGTVITHGDLGWRARAADDGRELVRAESVPALRALLPYSGI